MFRYVIAIDRDESDRHCVVTQTLFLRQEDRVYVFRARGKNKESFTNWSFYVIVDMSFHEETIVNGAC